MKIPEGFRKQSSNLNRDNGLIGIMPCRNPSQGMRSGTWRHFGSASSSDQCTISCPQTQIWWGKKEDPTCPLCQGRQTIEHVLSSCKIALSQGRYTWRHNRVLQELAAIISTAKGETTLPNTNALIFTTEGGAKSWHGRPVRTTNQIKCLLDGCDDWDVSADLPEWDSHPSIIKQTRLRPDIVIHSASTQQLIMVELTVPYENRMEEAHIYKREKYMNLTKELENAGYKAVVMLVEVGARGFVGSSVYDLLTKLSICGNKRTKALKLLAEIAENSSRWIWSRRNERFLHKD
ncbi:hypothetical protein RRG08_013359 [Elysia crispata]|uniref:Reverse transcriptase zinc-binding domain-containing protein n=1 Tax=Elysia crispata TaxID=231223 RepID=A0AAE1AYK2_9GAST|nr:hypothetical protein RRG08_013359 [Elysia crispata]